ncbi:uncharacterized protein BDZ99DRAFT_515926 [Mytilinidion resinicola]|uniref:Uncharacterized protein n=1 Tax=Mytilinidion resinicola TaxID=574789 RepID=A0A6A6Z2F7_9PEZI|nr:uncharacterized protein BDZ99DRAFT_515926 [Mytilinidion resinicola]KAF2815180.1 hypothetical protein BDZ99DRAFT_515926 [Mytilinidion resinicola]
MEEVVLPHESMTQMKQVIRKFNEAIEERLKLLLETPRAIKPKPSESTIFSMGSTLPAALISSPAAGLPAEIAAAEALHSDHLESQGSGQIRRRSSKHRPPLLARSDSVHAHTRSIAKTDAETISTQSQLASFSVSRSIDNRNDAQISVTPTLRDSSLDDLRSHSADASENESLRAENSNAIGLPTGQTYLLRRGRKTKLNIQRGYSVHLILPKIHFEFIYESKEEATSGDTAFAVLTSEWLVSLDSDPDTTHINLEDLTVNREVPCSNIFEKNGIVIHSQGQMVFMQLPDRNHRTADIEHRIAEHLIPLQRNEEAINTINHALKTWSFDASVYKPELARTAFLKAKLLEKLGKEQKASVALKVASRLRRELTNRRRNAEDLTMEDFECLLSFWSR